MVFVNPAALKKLRQAPAVAFPFTISETTGNPPKTLILRGRSLPYRGANWGAELRVDVKYFPGNPVAQSQVLGPMWTPTTIRGMWKDVFLFEDENAVRLLNFPEIGTPGVPGTFNGGKSFQSGGSIGSDRARRARVVRDAMFLLQRSGQLLKVEWGSISRFGFIKSMDFDHDREEDIRWEMEFTWIADTEAAPIVKSRPGLDSAGLLARILAALAAAIAAMSALLIEILGAVLAISQKIAKIGSLVAGLVDLLAGFVSLVFVPAQLFGVLKQQLTGIVLAIKDLLDTLRAVPAAYGAALAGGIPTEINASSAATLAIAFNASVLGVELADQRDTLTELETPDLLGIVTVQEGTTLRDISTQFYGTPDNWTIIADFNGLSSSIVERGTIIYVPALDQTQ